MSFFLFILINAVLFVRPAEIVPELESLPIYEWLIIACILVALPAIVDQLRWTSLRERPISLCVIGMLIAVAMSHLSHLNLVSARECTVQFSKIVLYYLLLVGVVDSPSRLRTLLVLLVGFIVVVAGLALLQYHKVIDLPSLTMLQQQDYDPETGEMAQTLRLVSTGIFKDPNDLSMILVVGIAIGAWKLFDPTGGVSRPIWLVPIGLFGYALTLTQSRGGLMALLAAMTVLLQAKYGWRRTVPLVALAAAIMLLLFGGGRQTDFLGALDRGTGTERLQLWAQAFRLFQGAPLFGIGQLQSRDELGLVPHNSFVHCYTELGFLGGTIFFAAFFISLVSLHKVRSNDSTDYSPTTVPLRPYLLAAVVGYVTAMLGVSRSYGVPTYMILGLATAYLRSDSGAVPLDFTTVNERMIRRTVAASLLFLTGIYVFTRFAVRWT